MIDRIYTDCARAALRDLALSREERAEEIERLAETLARVAEEHRETLGVAPR